MNKLFISMLLLSGSVAFAADSAIGEQIGQAATGTHRSTENQARNVYRHPVETLTFFGLADGMTVMEISPGGGWYTEIIAPVMRNNGQYIAAVFDADVPDQPAYRYGLNKDLEAKIAASPELYDQVVLVPFSPPQSASLGNANSIDLIVTFRNTHGWISEGVAQQVFTEFSRVLKPGGALGVVQHRAADGTDPKVTAETGYVSEEAVIAMAAEAGLVLEARSEINANPADTKDYPGGVWTLPPGLDACADAEDEAAKAACEAPYKAIGESDRMTLLFRKPVG